MLKWEKFVSNKEKKLSYCKSATLKNGMKSGVVWLTLKGSIYLATGSRFPPCKSLRFLLQELIYEPSRQPGGPKRHRVKDQKSDDTAYQDSIRICPSAQINDLRARDNHYINALKLLWQYDNTYFCRLLPKSNLILYMFEIASRTLMLQWWWQITIIDLVITDFYTERQCTYKIWTGALFLL